jgi:FkbM family methyltransferase
VLPTGVVSFLQRHRKLGGLALRCVPDIRHRITIEHIGPFDIRLRRNRSLWIRSPLVIEGLMLGYLKRLVRPGDVVYDIGANVGLYTRFAIEFGAARTIAFEPMADNIELLRRNAALARDGAAKIEVLELAVGDSDGEELLQVDDVMSATASLDRVRGGAPSEGHQLYGIAPKTQRVKVAKLDTLVFEQKLAPPRVMKIDIEGAELLALRGASRVLREHRPSLAIEIHSADIGRDVLALLGEHGYSVFAYVKEGKGNPSYRSVPTDQPSLLQPYDHIVASTDPEQLKDAIRPLS